MANLEKLTLRHVLNNSVKSFPEETALAEIGGDAYTYEALEEKVAELSSILHSKGIVEGDRVALLSENRPNWGVSYLSITTIGAVVVPILPEFHENEVHHILRHSECKAIFISERLYDKIEEFKGDDLETVILIEDFQIIPPEMKKDMLSDVMRRGSQEFAKLKSAALKFTGKVPAEVQEDDLACVIYTSGTTGNSKGVMLTHKNLVFDMIAASKIQPLVPGDRMLSVLPLSHTFECTLGFILPIYSGATVYYLKKPPTPRLLMEALSKVRPTLMLTVPLVIEKIYKTKILPEFTKNGLMRKLYKFPLTRRNLNRIAGKKLYAKFGGKLKFFGIGGALLAPEVERFLRDAKFPYAIGYGLTETSPISAGAGPGKTKYRSTGPVLPGGELKIHGANPFTGEGEIYVRGDHVMKGYYRDPDLTAEVITEDGWFKTGDLGKMDKDGYVFIKGRVKNMLLGPSGENIYPEQVESVINEFDYVMESLVFLMDGSLTARLYLNYEELDKLFKEEKLTASKQREKIKEILENIRVGANERLSSFSRIRKIIEQPEPFEKTPTQKIKRYLYVE